MVIKEYSRFRVGWDITIFVLVTVSAILHSIFSPHITIVGLR
jgi:hypothetical protein